MRKVILSADNDLREEFKWNSPVFNKNGNVCSIGVFKNHLKVNFFQGAEIEDPLKIFNSGFDAKNSRGIDIQENDRIDEVGLKSLVRRAININERMKI